jgi:hypothetical protein
MGATWTVIMTGSAVSSVFAGVLLAMLATSDAASSVALGDIEARLFYKGTGRLSEDLLSLKKEFWFHNAMIGEGDAEEPADDLMISVKMITATPGTAQDNHKFVDSPVEIVARDIKGKILGRRVHDTVLTSYEGTEHKVLWLSDVTCAGEIKVTATFEKQTRSATLSLGCGE